MHDIFEHVILSFCASSDLGRLVQVSHEYNSIVGQNLIFQKCVEIYQRNIIFIETFENSYEYAVSQLYHIGRIGSKTRIAERKYLKSLPLTGEISDKVLDKWFWNITEIEEDVPFKYACKYGYFEMAKRLYSYYYCTSIISDVFVMSCENGHLEIAKWLYSINNLRDSTYRGFIRACEHGHESVAQWLSSVRKPRYPYVEENDASENSGRIYTILPGDIKSHYYTIYTWK